MWAGGRRGELDTDKAWRRTGTMSAELRCQPPAPRVSLVHGKRVLLAGRGRTRCLPAQYEIASMYDAASCKLASFSQETEKFENSETSCAKRLIFCGINFPAVNFLWECGSSEKLKAKQFDFLIKKRKEVKHLPISSADFLTPPEEDRRWSEKP